MQLVHEDRRIFGSLDVEENLVLAGLTAPKRWPLERIYAMFPRLKARRRSRGTDLSGGGQQMLAVGRAPSGRPKLLMIDELSLGLAPVIVKRMFPVVRRIADELGAGQAVITHKHDGSLIIRSVLPDGRVVFRTRDTFDGGKFASLAEAVARAKYPALLDPAFHPHGSLLFEYVGVGNQIVVRYEGEDDLILLGAAEHGDGLGAMSVRYLSYTHLVPFGAAHGLRVVETYDWAEAAGGVAAVLALVQGWDKAEGVVVRSGDGQTLLKVKSAWYFAQHALRWHVKLSTIARFCIDGGISDEATFMEKLTANGWDYETATVALGYFHEYQKRRAQADVIKAEAMAFLEAFNTETLGRFAEDEAGVRARRKAYAERIFGPSATPEVQTLRPYLFLVYDSKHSKMDATLLRRIIMDRGTGGE